MNRQVEKRFMAHTMSEFPGEPGAVMKDPLDAPETGAPRPPLLRDELPPIRPSLLDFSPVTKRMENLDAMRIVCMTVIITTHVTEPYIDAMHRSGSSSLMWLAVLTVNVMGRFGVPCFMMISFFIYWHQLYEKGRSWGELLARRLKRLVPAFVCWSGFYFLLHRRVYKRFGNSEWYTPLNAYKYSLKNWHTWWGLFLGQAEYHLYYLPLVMQFLLCIPILRLLWRRPVVAWGWIGATTAAWAMLVYGPLLFADGTGGHRLTIALQRTLDQPWAIPFLLFPLFGMMCAGQLAWRKFVAHSSASFWVGLLILGLSLHAVEALFLSRVLPQDGMYLKRVAVYVKLGRVVTSFAVFGLFIRQPLMRDPFPRVSHYAFGLHFMHPFIILAISFCELEFFGADLAHFRHHALPVLAINLLLTFTITFALCLVIGRFKRLEFLVV
jgi:surface polysaccharide O-acyltransferase-like enzyme